MKSPLASRTLTLVTLLVTFMFTAVAQDKPSLLETDRVRLAETFSVADRLGDLLWMDWSKAPFAVLLVTMDHEFLIRHPKPSADFTKIEFDKRLNSDVYYRKRQFPTHWLATFPAIKGSPVSTIVVGRAEQTDAKTSTPWVVVLLHEHFHQLQDSQPNFYADVNALNLSGGDQTGMWMLNYPFPYDRKEVQDQFAILSKSLLTALEAPKSQRARRVQEYLAARKKFQSMVSPADARYLSFQFWKEGIARYTEYHIARLAEAHHLPSKEFRALPDYQTFAEVAKETRERILKQLTTQRLGETKREVVYPFGAAEGLLLDEISPGWRSRYFVEKFDLAGLYK
ncbi:MAG TPA: hypothetical protein VIT88_06180 [Pyrinomonadaceae bacterium]